MDNNTEKRETPGEIALTFLNWLDATGTHHLSAIDPRDGTVDGRAFGTDQRHLIPAWVNEREGQLNLYFTANEVRADFGGAKPAKADIAAIRALYVDVDPQKGENLEEERARIAALFEANAPVEFSAVVDSGNGYQALAVLSEKLPIDAAVMEWAEAYSRGLAHPMGGDNTQNIDRLLRLPGATNIPTLAKAARGSVPRVARILRQSDRRVTESEIIDKIVPLQRPVSSAGEDEAISAAILDVEHSEFADVPDYEDLPADLRQRFESDIKRNDGLRQLWNRGRIDHPNPTGSEYRFALAGILKRAGNYTAAEYGTLAWVWRFSNLPEKYDREGAARQIGREWGRAAGLINPSDWFSFMTAETVAKAAKDAERANSTMAPIEPSLFDLEARAANVTGAPDDVYPVLRISDILDRPRPVFLVKEFLPQMGVGIAYGASGAKKSFMAFDLSMSIAHGFDEWHGRRINATGDGSVIFIAAEGGFGLKQRIKAWLQVRGITDFNNDKFFAIDRAVNFQDAENIDRLIRTAKALSACPALIVIDTVSTAIPGADENTSADMTIFIDACKRLQHAFGSCVMGVHHTVKGGKTMRGSSVLEYGSDFVLRVESPRGELSGSILVEKQKDGADGMIYPFRLVHHVILDEEPDEDGKPTSSLVFDHLGRNASIGSGEGSGRPAMAVTERDILERMAGDYSAGNGWLNATNVADQGRQYARFMASAFGITADEARNMVKDWIACGKVTVEKCPKQRARVLVPMACVVDLWAAEADADNMGVFG